MENKEKEVLLKVRGARTYFPIKKGLMKRTVGYVKAVDDISLDVYKGETLGLVGESGCGKTTLGKSILQLVPITDGSMEYKFEDGYKNLRDLSRKEIDNARQKIQIVFQDPYSSLNPAFTIFGSLEDPLIKFGMKKKEDRIKKIGDLLEAVNLPRDYMTRYPNEFSGGQRQRIGIARAMVMEPELVIADEPISALDVSIRAQVLNLLSDLQKKRNLTYLFIAHDLLVVRHISDRIAVMYLGKMVELADADEIYDHPMHPYSKSLLSSVPVPDPETARNNKRIILEGDIPSPLNAPSGCPFRTRCRYATDVCAQSMPEFKEVKPGHFCACHNLENVD